MKGRREHFSNDHVTTNLDLAFSFWFRRLGSGSSGLSSTTTIMDAGPSSLPKKTPARKRKAQDGNGKDSGLKEEASKPKKARNGKGKMKQLEKRVWPEYFNDVRPVKLSR